MLTWSEGSAIGAFVTQANTTENDVGVNSEVVYSLANPSGAFAINSVTGVVTIAAGLDRETVSSYTLIVNATNKGTPPLSATTTLRVVLLDENDNAPVFDAPSYSVSVKEDAALDLFIVSTPASDADIDSNAGITSIRSSPGMMRVCLALTAIQARSRLQR